MWQGEVNSRDPRQARGIRVAVWIGFLIMTLGGAKLAPDQSGNPCEERIVDTSGSITLLIDQLNSENAAIRRQAESAIWERLSPMLLALLSHRLAPGIRRREDEEDIANDAFKSFCLRQSRGEFKPQDRTALKKLLWAIAYRKLCNVVEWHSAARRDYRRDRSASPAEARGADSSSAWLLLDVIEAPRSSQEMEALLDEALEPILKTLNNPELRDILRLRLEDETTQEISKRFGFTERTVQRRMEEIRRKLASLEPELKGLVK
jgi:RNA polymerase sigma factor (sigma-70 family)